MASLLIIPFNSAHSTRSHVVFTLPYAQVTEIMIPVTWLHGPQKMANICVITKTHIDEAYN